MRGRAGTSAGEREASRAAKFFNFAWMNLKPWRRIFSTPPCETATREEVRRDEKRLPTGNEMDSSAARVIRLAPQTTKVKT